MHDATRIARKLSALVNMGFERVDVPPVTTESVRVDRRTHKVTQTTPAMGTLVSVSVLARSTDRAEEAIGRAFEEMHGFIRVFSRYDGSSAVTRLNDDGRLTDGPPEFADLVSSSLQFHDLTRGAFDISVEPVVNLFRETLDGEQPREPTPAEVAEALELVDSASIGVSGGNVSLSKSGMGVTLDGIAKGYIVDAMARVLAGHKVKHYLINAGGDIRTGGRRENREPWTVAVQNPTKSGSFPDTIHLTNQAVATSGGYEIYFDRDKLFHHIVNSSSGRSPNRNLSVSVIAPSAMAADALATGVFVLDDPRQGVKLIDSMPGCECLIIDADGLQLRSRGWRSAPLLNGKKAGL